MNENEQLRRRIAELEKQLIQARPRSVLELELRRRGLPDAVIPDALQLLKAEHAPSEPQDLATRAVWRTAADPELRTLTELVDEFQESRSYLFPSTERAEPAPAGPTYADGRPVPVAEWSDEELAVAAGPTPAPEKPPERQYTVAELENMPELDRLAVQAGSAPEVARDDSGIDEVNRELAARAETREAPRQQQIESGSLPMFQTKKAWGQS